MRLDRMKYMRKARGLSQYELAERLGRDQSYVSKIERGMTVPMRVAEDIAHALLCNVSDLAQPEEPTLTFKLSELTPEVIALLKK
jgi:transcriptional regulator with XRE-family HTH domain